MFTILDLRTEDVESENYVFLKKKLSERYHETNCCYYFL